MAIVAMVALAACGDDEPRCETGCENDAAWYPDPADHQSEFACSFGDSNVSVTSTLTYRSDTASFTGSATVTDTHPLKLTIADPVPAPVANDEPLVVTVDGLPDDTYAVGQEFAIALEATCIFGCDLRVTLRDPSDARLRLAAWTALSFDTTVFDDWTVRYTEQDCGPTDTFCGKASLLALTAEVAGVQTAASAGYAAHAGEALVINGQSRTLAAGQPVLCTDSGGILYSGAIIAP